MYFTSVPSTVSSHWITFSPLPKSSKNKLSGKNSQCFSVTSNRRFSFFPHSLSIHDQGDLVRLSTLPIPTLLEPAHLPLIASPGLQWHSSFFQKAQANAKFQMHLPSPVHGVSRQHRGVSSKTFSRPCREDHLFNSFL